jgi:hypothetical protein
MHKVDFNEKMKDNSVGADDKFDTHYLPTVGMFMASPSSTPKVARLVSVVW